MSRPTQDGPTPVRASSPREQRRVVLATVVGTTVEWYDFFLYAAAAGLVFGQLFFEPAGSGLATLLAFGSVGVSFLFRPLGAIIAGHLGDRYGRRVVLVFTLLLMGTATALIGLLPTYGQIGVTAPVLLVLLRILQGISAGGEWGGAVLMSTEHAPAHRRGLFGASPQVGVPLGLLLSSAMMAIMSAVAPGDAFLTWGWRVPFLLSIVLIGVGFWVRRSVEESPVFVEIADRKETTHQPLLRLFKKHTPLVFVAAFIFAGNNAVGYMTAGGYIQRYASDPAGPVGLDRGPVLWAVTISAVVWLVSTWSAAALSDHLGRRTTLAVGFVAQLVGVLALFPLVNLGTFGSLLLGLSILSIGLGLSYGPQSALNAELYPASIRFSGAAASHATGSILGGAFAPTIATALVQATGATTSVTFYLAGMTVIGLAATLLLRDRTGIPLGPDHEEEQAVSPIYGLSRA
ncbi:MFS transporter [Promicromonospora sp. Populi]|uniref:MFS transporter n=1 Tax=Promicromonospora sp. Populi TaxID=3239420 RepID=UPI0034E2DF65